VAEGPTAIAMGGTTYLLYSGGYYLGPGYGEGEAIRRGSPLGPYQRIGNGPVLHGDHSWVGTGGGSIVHTQGRLLFAYNSFPRGEQQPKRRLFVRPLRLVGHVLWPAGRPTRIPLEA
jgi:hypothetical protein